MNIDQYKNKFIEATQNKNLKLEFISKCIKYAGKLLGKNLPIIYSIDHLSKLVWYNKSYIQRAIHPQYQRHMYRHYEIPKKNWEKRGISEPLPSLKEIQTRILNNVLNNISVSKYAKSYIKWVSIKQHVNYHKWSKKVLTLDITNFFWSITLEKVKTIFENMGYTKELSLIFARLCTLRGILAQWSPSSPYISNIYLKNFDEEIYQYCENRKIKFTRYADDMAFSWEFDENELIQFITQKLYWIWLSLNHGKTNIMDKSNRQIISWVVVNRKIQIPKETRNQIRNTMFYIKKFWLDSHMEKTNITQANYLRHLIGQINYVLYMNPKDNEFSKYKEYLKQLLNG